MTCNATQNGPVGNSIAVLANVHGVNQEAITQISVSSISRTIYLDSTGDVVTGPTALVVANVVFDTLQTDYGWTATEGYNFRDIINGTMLTSEGALKIVYTLIGADGLQSVMVMQYHAETVS